VLQRIVLEPHGLILVTGPAASGKSTTLAALVDHLNATTEGHVVAIEDPIEVVHPQKRCVVSQREVGKDTHGYASALRAALRQAPNVILIGEMRDRETIELALRAAETGHLVIGTLHTTDAVQTLQRVVNVFPHHEREAVLVMLSQVLRCCLSQRLLRRADGRGRVPVVDLLVQTGAVQDAIRKGALDDLYTLVDQGAYDGMVSAHQSLLEHFQSGALDAATCLASAPQRQAMAMAMRAELRALQEKAEALASHGRPAPAPRAAADAAAASGDFIKVIKMHKPGNPPR
jgi:twitching motility protein PilT